MECVVATESAVVSTVHGMGSGGVAEGEGERWGGGRGQERWGSGRGGGRVRKAEMWNGGGMKGGKGRGEVVGKEMIHIRSSQVYHIC